MAKQTLPVNFQDDIMSDSMDGKRKYRMIQNADGTVSFEDVTTYDQVGSIFGMAQINATNTAVNASADASKIIDDPDAIAANTQAGYIAGALALKEVSANLRTIVLWENPDPVKAFHAQTITLSTDDYDCYEVFFNTYGSCRAIKEYGTSISSGDRAGGSFAEFWRHIKYINANQLQFSGAFRYDQYGVHENQNTELIPIKIIGYKFNL